MIRVIRMSTCTTHTNIDEIASNICVKPLRKNSFGKLKGWVLVAPQNLFDCPIHKHILLFEGCQEADQPIDVLVLISQVTDKTL